MILVSGASGTNGREIVRMLLQSGQSVRALVRDSSRAHHLADMGAELADGDFTDQNSLERALKGVSRALLLTPVDERAVEWNSRFVQAARKAGVSRLVRFSGMGASLHSPSQILRQHAESDAEVRASGLDWTILQPNSFYQNLLWSAATIRDQGVFYLPLAEARQSLVDVADISQVAALALSQPGHSGQTYTITGPTALTMEEVASAMTEVLGRKIQYVSVSPDQAAEGMRQSGAPDWNARAVAELMSYFAAGQAADISDTVERLTGRPATPIRDFLSRHRSGFG